MPPVRTSQPVEPTSESPTAVRLSFPQRGDLSYLDRSLGLAKEEGRRRQHAALRSVLQRHKRGKAKSIIPGQRRSSVRSSRERGEEREKCVYARGGMRDGEREREGEEVSQSGRGVMFNRGNSR